MKLAEVRRYALSLPEVTEEPHHHLSSYRVRGRIFVTVPPEGHEIRRAWENKAPTALLRAHDPARSQT